MNLSICFILCALLVSQTLAASPVTLEEAYFTALKKTEVVSIGQARVNQSEARIEQARSRFFPNLAFGANFQQQDTNGALSRQSSALFGGRQSYTRLTLSQSIFEGGRDRAFLNAANSDAGVQAENLSVAKYNTFATVARGFYAILSSQREAENIRKTIALGNDRIKEIRRRTKIGRSRNIEIMAAQAQLSVLEAQLMGVEGQLVIAKDQFLLTTGLPADVNLVEAAEEIPSPKNIETYTALLEKRPDIMAIKSQIEMSRSNLTVAKAGHWPSLSAAGNYYITREGTQKGNNWDVGATLTFPLFSGLIVVGQVRESAEREAEAEFLLGQTRRFAEIAVRTAYNSLMSALNQLKAFEDALKSTEENYKEQEKNYRFGQATNLDVIQALNSFQDTKRTLDRTRYIAKSAWTDLKAAIAEVPSEGQNTSKENQL